MGDRGECLALPTPVFITVEGLDGVGKSTLCKRLAGALAGAVQLRTPPDDMRPFRDYFDHSPHRSGYYMVGNFLAGEQAKRLKTEGKTVVCDRFYASTRAYENDASASDDVFDWPEQLVRPDLMIVLTLDEGERQRRLAGRLHLLPETSEEAELRRDPQRCQRINAAYKRMGCAEVSAAGSEDDVLRRVVDYVRSAASASATAAGQPALPPQQ